MPLWVSLSNADSGIMLVRVIALQQAVIFWLRLDLPAVTAVQIPTTQYTVFPPHGWL